jgi:precorrin-6A/cobalt-precorrin-6A reductase
MRVSMGDRLLILGGTGEARALAQAVVEAMPKLAITTSLAGRTRDPLIPPGEVRIGGFGGVDGLLHYLEENGVTLLVNATHPFAAEMSAHALAAHRASGIPLLRLLRPAWEREPEDSWIPALDVAAAAEICRGHGKRIFLSLGAKDLSQFAGTTKPHFLVRLVDAPASLPLARYEIVAARGPFTVADERALMAQHGIDLIVTKNSGGDATHAKIAVARELGIPVVMIQRPEIALHPESDVAASLEATLGWIAARTGAKTARGL